MQIHLPKPLHGWRAFAGEVGIIVLGVLIALGFGQIVEQWQWDNEVGTTREALANELVAPANQGAERIAVENCLRDRISELSARLKVHIADLHDGRLARLLGNHFRRESGAFGLGSARTAE